MALTMAVSFKLTKNIKIVLLPNRMLLWIWDVITDRRILAKFRSCNLPLAVETGRYTKPKTLLAERLCKFCDSAAVEDEIHFLIDCEFYSDIRYNYANIINTDFMSLTSKGKFIYLMQNDALQIKLASSLLLMNGQRRSAVCWRIAQILLVSAFL